MSPRKANLLITGVPGVGKTTLIKNLADVLKDTGPVGFYTSEIRERGIRKGFELVGLHGGKGILSHVDIKGPYRVGKYGVDVSGFERFLDAIPLSGPSPGIVLIDEIGKMECFSERFKERVVEILESGRPLVATIALKGSGFIAEVKSRKDVTLLDITRHNRDTLVAEISRDLGIHG